MAHADNTNHGHSLRSAMVASGLAKQNLVYGGAANECLRSEHEISLGFEATQVDLQLKLQYSSS